MGGRGKCNAALVLALLALLVVVLLFAVLAPPVPDMIAARLALIGVEIVVVGVVTLLATTKLVFSEVVEMLDGTAQVFLEPTYGLAVMLVL